MDPKSLQKFLIPAVAVAALIVVLALLSGKGSESASSKSSKAGKTKVESGDATDAGMTDAVPSNDALEWKPEANGLKIWDVKEGTGEPVSRGQTVTAHYTGWRANDGFAFDSSRKRGEATTFSLDEVIQGWKNGIPGMKVGGIRRLYIPSALGYGPQGSRGGIPPNTDLIFEVKLVAYE
jgi:FKBP-type peptidyl-prolyl cis-trans isomerase